MSCAENDESVGEPMLEPQGKIGKTLFVAIYIVLTVMNTSEY